MFLRLELAVHARPAFSIMVLPGIHTTKFQFSTPRAARSESMACQVQLGDSDPARYLGAMPMDIVRILNHNLTGLMRALVSLDLVTTKFTISDWQHIARSASYSLHKLLGPASFGHNANNSPRPPHIPICYSNICLIGVPTMSKVDPQSPPRIKLGAILLVDKIEDTLSKFHPPLG